jgi:hypothetical protein
MKQISRWVGILIVVLALAINVTPYRAQESAECHGYLLLDFSTSEKFKGREQDLQGRIEAALNILSKAKIEKPSEALAMRISLDRTKVLVEATFLFEVSEKDLLSAMNQFLEISETEVVVTWFGQACDFESSSQAASEYLEKHLAEWETPQESPRK